MTDGELWTRQVLADLRACSYRPGAWRTFVAESFARARIDRRAHPHEHRQIVLMAAIGACAWLAAAPWSPLVAAIAIVWWLVVVTMLDWHVGMLQRPDGRSLGGVGAPNLISLARLGAAPVLLMLKPLGIGVAILIFAASDIADGVLARRHDLVTRLGRWLDGAADGVMLVTAVLVLTAHGVIAAWVTAIVVARHAAQWAGVGVGYFARGVAPSSDHVVPARAAGAVIVAGIVAAPLARGLGATLIVAGAAGGVIAVALTARRAFVAGPDMR